MGHCWNLNQKAANKKRGIFKLFVFILIWVWHPCYRGYTDSQLFQSTIWPSSPLAMTPPPPSSPRWNIIDCNELTFQEKPSPRSRSTSLGHTARTRRHWLLHSSWFSSMMWCHSLQVHEALQRLAVSSSPKILSLISAGSISTKSLGEPSGPPQGRRLQRRKTGEAETWCCIVALVVWNSLRRKRSKHRDLVNSQWFSLFWTPAEAQESSDLQKLEDPVRAQTELHILKAKYFTWVRERQSASVTIKHKEGESKKQEQLWVFFNL